MEQIIVILSFAFLNFGIGFFLADLVDEKYKVSLKSLFDKDLNRQYFFGLILGLLSIPLTQYYLFHNDDVLYVHGFIISNTMITILLFSAYYDIKYYEVLNKLTKLLILYLILLNIVIWFFFSSTTDIVIFNNYQFSPLSNLIAGAIAWSIFTAIVTITNEKGMGSGDIRIATILGLSFGIGKFLLGFYISIFSALLIAFILFLLKKDSVGFKTKLPFVPFLVFGALLALYLPFDFFDLI